LGGEPRPLATDQRCGATPREHSCLRDSYISLAANLTAALNHGIQRSDLEPIVILVLALKYETPNVASVKQMVICENIVVHTWMFDDTAKL
jgi:hypothetical protein